SFRVRSTASAPPSSGKLRSRRPHLGQVPVHWLLLLLHSTTQRSPPHWFTHPYFLLVPKVSPPTLSQVALTSSSVCVPATLIFPAEATSARNPSVARAMMMTRNLRIEAS